MKEKDLLELNAKIDAVIVFLKEHNGASYKMYNHTCPGNSDEPDSNIIEYAEDIKEIINKTALQFIELTEEDMPF